MKNTIARELFFGLLIFFSTFFATCQKDETIIKTSYGDVYVRKNSVTLFPDTTKVWNFSFVLSQHADTTLIVGVTQPNCRYAMLVIPNKPDSSFSLCANDGRTGCVYEVDTEIDITEPVNYLWKNFYNKAKHFFDICHAENANVTEIEQKLASLEKTSITRMAIFNESKLKSPPQWHSIEQFMLELEK